MVPHSLTHSLAQATMVSNGTTLSEIINKIPALDNCNEFWMSSVLLDNNIPSDSLLHCEFKDNKVIQDSFSVFLTSKEAALLTGQIENNIPLSGNVFCGGEMKLPFQNSYSIMESLLTAFIENPSPTVGMFMSLRNTLVSPFKLRTSHLGCPVSSLLGTSKTSFGIKRKFPVRNQMSTKEKTQVTLGANDKHLQFRSVVAVELITREKFLQNNPFENGKQGGTMNSPSDIVAIRIELSDKILTLNWFGRLYMTLIDWGHKNLIAPPLIQYAVEYLITNKKSK
jgi:hypothetical protein